MKSQKNINIFDFIKILTVVSQYFEVQVYDVFAIRGNAAIFKCQVPSFVADHVDVASWIDSDGGNYRADDEQASYGTRYIVCASGASRV